MFVDVTGEVRTEEKEPEKKSKAAYNWCFENNINSEKTPIDINAQGFKYEKWRTNSALSNHMDTLFYSNAMNLLPDVSDQMHYDYLFNSVRKIKRYGKKKTDLDKRIEREHKEEQEKIALIQEYYKYNQARAREALRILTKENLETIRKKIEKGGTK